MAKVYGQYFPKQDLFVSLSPREPAPEDHGAYFVFDRIERLELSADGTNSTHI